MLEYFEFEPKGKGKGIFAFSDERPLACSGGRKSSGGAHKPALSISLAETDEVDVDRPPLVGWLVPEAEGSELIEDVDRTGIVRVEERHVVRSTLPATARPAPPVGGWPITDATGRHVAPDRCIYTFILFLADCAPLSFDALKASIIGRSDRSTSFHPEFLALCGDSFLQPIACDRRDPESDSQPRPHHCDARAARLSRRDP
jgi:hypothetical protein